MKEETPRPDDKISAKRDKEDRIMSISTTAEHALDTKPHEQQVCQGVDDFGRVDRRIVVLRVYMSQQVSQFPSKTNATQVIRIYVPLHTNSVSM